MSGYEPQDYDPRRQQPATPPQWQAQPGYGQQYPPQGWQQYPPQYQPPQMPPPRRSWIRRHKILTGFITLFLFFISIGIGASLHGTQSQDGTGASSFTGTAPAAGPATSAAAAQHAAKQTVTFEVTGSQADVTYGPSGTSVSGSVPMKVTKPLGNPIYYSLQAQLQGGGTVTCKIKVDGKVISESVASGGYNIADCEISRDIISGDWTDTNAG